ncbi:MAG TPA: Ig-like domain-containing protein [Streptosporangiaceae bacterium]|nr:Ig-like domain-containing protein [Streptosporangiaceae bacterium]
MRGTTRIYASVVAAVTIGLLTAACSSGPPQTPAQASASASASSSAASAAASAHAALLASELKIAPANGSRGVNPSAGITVTATKGKVTNVTVAAPGGATVSGALRDGGRVWHSTWALGVSQRYTVTATGTDGSGQRITTTSSFRTLAPASTFSTEIYEGSDQTYGVGMPIMLIFSQPVTNRAAVERSLQLTTSKPVIGSWYWDDSEHLDFRPRDYWPANTTVSFEGHLDGVQGASGVYGAANLTQTFTIGRSLIAVASTTTHKTQIYLNGKLTYDWPISTGRASLPTPDGTYVSVEKNNPVRMIGGGAPGSAGYYNELVNYAVRFTFSGDYYHSAPWSVIDQGTTNVSHGCVNLPPEDATIYYNMSIPGDPITVTASTAAGKWDDGWTEWFLPFSQFVKGSALGMAVAAGPQGSQFVAPSSLPADTASSPLDTSAAGNYYAGSANIANAG